MQTVCFSTGWHAIGRLFGRTSAEACPEAYYAAVNLLSRDRALTRRAPGWRQYLEDWVFNTLGPTLHAKPPPWYGQAVRQTAVKSQICMWPDSEILQPPTHTFLLMLAMEKRHALWAEEQASARA